MHEFGLCEAIVQTAQQRAEGRPVARIRVRVSALLRAEDDSMQQAFSMVRTGTELNDATLDLVEVPGLGTCNECGAETQMENAWDPCPTCGEHALSATNADEMILEEVEYHALAGEG